VIAFGVSLCIAMQAIFNLCVATGLVPPKGINLPFVSYGGSSLLVLGAAVGLLLAVARENDAPAAVPAAELDELGMADDRATGPTSLGGAAS
jgi:cell division protein FtsW